MRSHTGKTDAGATSVIDVAPVATSAQTNAQGLIDGRSARAERTRRAVIDAHMTLIKSGELKPTGAQIASRAGVSLRSLWGHFGDLETLFEASSAELFRRHDLTFDPVDISLDLDERLDVFCVQRGEVLEFIAPFARALAIRVPFSRELQRVEQKYLTRAANELRRVFGEELSALDTASARQIEGSMMAATTWGTWAFLRDVMHLSSAEATQVMKRAVGAVLRDAQQVVAEPA